MTAQAHVFYMDIRSGGKGYDEFVRRAIEQDGAKYYRGRVSKITQENGKLIVRGADTLAGMPITIEADLVVLASAMRPAPGIEELAQKLNVGYDEHGFLMESHPKLRPVETNTAGVYIAGAVHAPKDIPESVAQASAAASKVQITLAADHLFREPEIAGVNEQTCAACYTCVRACAYHAIDRAEVRTGRGVFIKHTARVNPGLCMGCGTCVSVCPSKSIELQGFTEQQIYAMVESHGMNDVTQFEPKILAYVCNWCTYLGADLAGTTRLEYPPNIRIVRLPCTGRIDFNLLIKAFEVGADAVLVSGCHPGDCHYTSGNYHARRRWILFRELLDLLGFDLERIHFTWISAAEGKKFQQVVTDITEKTRKLGPYTELYAAAPVRKDDCRSRPRSPSSPKLSPLRANCAPKPASC